MTLSEPANPFRAPLEATPAPPLQDMADRLEGMHAAIQTLSLMQQSASLGLASQIRELSDRVAALELLVLRFVDAAPADKRKPQ
jgi:hypothetical protein